MCIILERWVLAFIKNSKIAKHWTSDSQRGVIFPPSGGLSISVVSLVVTIGRYYLAFTGWRVGLLLNILHAQNCPLPDKQTTNKQKTIILPKMSIVLRFRNPGLDCRTLMEISLIVKTAREKKNQCTMSLETPVIILSSKTQCTSAIYTRPWAWH